MTTDAEEKREHSAAVVSVITGRADAAIKRALPGYSRAEITRLFQSKRVRRFTSDSSNQRALRPGDDVTKGDTLEVILDASLNTPFAPPNAALELEVIHVEAGLVVVNKQPGLPSHPLDHHDARSVLSAVNARYPEVASAGPHPREGGLLHRLDTFTGGALAFARNPTAYERGREWFSNPEGDERAQRAYLAIIDGERATGARIECTHAIAHHKSDRRKMVVVETDSNPAAGEGSAAVRGQPKVASTKAVVVASRSGQSVVLAHAVGGRRHQVRVHLAHVGAALIGDSLYGGGHWPEADAQEHHALWACALKFPRGEWVVALPTGVFATTLARFGVSAADTGWWESALGDPNR